MKKVFLEISQNSQKNTCARVSLLIKLQACARVSLLIKLQASGNFFKKKTLAQVFSCEFCEISKNNCFTEHLWVTSSGPSEKAAKKGIYIYKCWLCK